MEFENKLIVITGGAGGIARETARLLLAGGAQLLLIDPSAAALEARAAELASGERVRIAVSALSRPRPVPPRSPGSTGRSLGSCTSPASSGRMRWIRASRAVGRDDRGELDQRLRHGGRDQAAPRPRCHLPHGVRKLARIPPRLLRSHRLQRRQRRHRRPVRALARALAPDVLVNGVAPGIILTGMPEHMLDVPERRERLLAETTLKRFGEAREVATVIRFLLSDDSSFITGQLINVDGGVVFSRAGACTLSSSRRWPGAVRRCNPRAVPAGRRRPDRAGVRACRPER